MESANDHQYHVDPLPAWNRLTTHLPDSLGRRPSLYRLRVMAFGLMHIACLGVFVTGSNVRALALCGVVYLPRR